MSAPDVQRRPSFLAAVLDDGARPYRHRLTVRTLLDAGAGATAIAGLHREGIGPLVYWDPIAAGPGAGAGDAALRRITAARPVPPVAPASAAATVATPPPNMMLSAGLPPVTRPSVAPPSATSPVASPVAPLSGTPPVASSSATPALGVSRSATPAPVMSTPAAVLPGSTVSDDGPPAVRPASPLSDAVPSVAVPPAVRTGLVPCTAELPASAAAAPQSPTPSPGGAVPVAVVRPAVALAEKPPAAVPALPMPASPATRPAAQARLVTAPVPPIPTVARASRAPAPRTSPPAPAMRDPEPSDGPVHDQHPPARDPEVVRIPGSVPAREGIPRPTTHDRPTANMTRAARRPPVRALPGPSAEAPADLEPTEPLFPPRRSFAIPSEAPPPALMFAPLPAPAMPMARAAGRPAEPIGSADRSTPHRWRPAEKLNAERSRRDTGRAGRPIPDAFWLRRLGSLTTGLRGVR